MKFDYVNRRNNTLARSTDEAIKDITPDGAFLLLCRPGGKPGFSVLETKNGKKAAGNDNSCVFAFGRKPSEFFQVKGKKIIPGGNNAVLSEGPAQLTPVAVSHKRSRLLYRNEDQGVYYIYDVSSGVKSRVNNTPMILGNPQFSSDDSKLYFFRFNDLFQWTP